MSTKSAFRVWAAAILLLTALAISGNTAIALNECNPPDGVGATSKDCGTLITIDDINGIVISHTNQPPYDRDSLNPGDDTLVGVRNNSSKPLRSMVLRSALPIFEFDTDGICGISFITGQPFNHKPIGCPFKTGPGSTGYEGPRVSFTNLKPDFTEGTVRFDSEILSGGTTYFALEAAISAAFSCPAVINDSITTKIESRTRIVADFTPGKVPSNTSATSAAALFCGVKKFNWVQKITYLPDPSPYNAINPSRHIASAD